MENYKLAKFSSNRSLSEAEAIYNQRIEDAIDIFNKHKKNFFLRDCPFCGSGDYVDQEKFHGTYGVCKCLTCNSLYVNPCPNVDALEDYYTNSKCNILLDQLYKKRHTNANNFILDDRISKVMHFIGSFNYSSIKILEIGCGSGSFLSKLKYFIKKELPNIHVELYGIDVDKNAIKNKVDNELKLECSNAEEFTKNHKEKYDIILHFELIEHLIDPLTFMKSLNLLLKPGGLTIFTTPNSNGLEIIGSDYNSYRLIAHSIFPPMHLNAFSTFNITHFAIISNFSVLEVMTPGKLDIDIISLMKDTLNDQGLKLITELDDEIKALIQHLVALTNSSSHMMCIFKK